MIFGILGNTLTKLDLRLWNFQAPEMIKAPSTTEKAKYAINGNTKSSKYFWVGNKPSDFTPL
jgi:hypothetical protein